MRIASVRVKHKGSTQAATGGARAIRFAMCARIERRVIEAKEITKSYGTDMIFGQVGATAIIHTSSSGGAHRSSSNLE
jgi:hypothetical protein